MKKYNTILTESIKNIDIIMRVKLKNLNTLLIAVEL